MWKPVKTTLCVTLWSSAAVIQPQRPFAGTFVDAAIGAPRRMPCTSENGFP